MRKKVLWCATAASLVAGAGGTAWAAQEAAEVEGFRLQPILDARLRYEGVDQPGLEADAVTLRLRAGIEGKSGPFTILAEAEGTAAPVDSYNAFPFPIAGESQRRSGYAAIADPENLELNRLQLQYKSGTDALTIGRQRINLDDQRWVGSVGWRQNEQTFDAVRGEARIGSVAADLTYAISQRTVFGEDAGPRTAYGGDFVFAGLSAPLGPVQGKLFAYLIDYDEAFFLANSSQTYGAILGTSLPIVGGTKVSLRASYARQSDHGGNPFDYAADYWSLEAGTTLAGFTVRAGWERLGSDGGRAVQTPMATLHRFNGWADMFLTTPPQGLRDAFVSLGRRFERAGPFRGLQADIVFHQFDSAAGDLEYGTEWDASLGFQAGRVGITAKLANYDASGFGVDTRKVWLQAEWSF